MNGQRIALVTGASSGIGQATAVELAARGCQVAVHYHENEAGARRTFEAIQESGCGRARVYRADVADPVEVDRLAAEVLADFGRVDVLVNNAGSLVERRPLADMDYELWRRVLTLNLDSAFLVTRSLLPAMRSAGAGAIVHVASIAGRNGGGPGAGAYATAKGALITLTKAMAKEFIGYGIRVNCVNPGVIATPFHERFSPPELFQKLVGNIPQQRAGTSAEVAGVIAFLASDDASHVVGESIEINGGLLLD
ncbi:MAG: SDR family oxidoreductase [Alphaproteobacteria bacterium]|nr:SDR family oxidoreductase [Alphaproteobacteria bacterium]